MLRKDQFFGKEFPNIWLVIYNQNVPHNDYLASLTNRLGSKGNALISDNKPLINPG